MSGEKFSIAFFLKSRSIAKALKFISVIDSSLILCSCLVLHRDIRPD